MRTLASLALALSLFAPLAAEAASVVVNLPQDEADQINLGSAGTFYTFDYQPIYPILTVGGIGPTGGAMVYSVDPSNLLYSASMLGGQTISTAGGTSTDQPRYSLSGNALTIDCGCSSMYFGVDTNYPSVKSIDGLPSLTNLQLNGCTSSFDCDTSKAFYNDPSSFTPVSDGSIYGIAQASTGSDPQGGNTLAAPTYDVDTMATLVLSGFTVALALLLGYAVFMGYGTKVVRALGDIIGAAR